jgi:hypothetical protein
MGLPRNEVSLDRFQVREFFLFEWGVTATIVVGGYLLSAECLWLK